jgi:creatinine deaminase
MDAFIKAAIEEAKKGLDECGIPIGSVLVKDGKIVGHGHNKRVQSNDPIMHAEIEFLRNTRRLGKYEKTILYSTLMPCFLCAGAVVKFGIKKVIVGKSETFSGAKKLMESHGVEVIDMNLDECKKTYEEIYPKQT